MSKNMKTQLEIDLDEVTKKMKSYHKKVTNKQTGAITMVVASACVLIKKWMKKNRLWTDRTSDARDRLDCVYVWEDVELVSIVVFHQVSYGVWLELAHQRKYAILMESLEKHQDEIIDALQHLMDNIKP